VDTFGTGVAAGDRTTVLLQAASVASASIATAATGAFDRVVIFVRAVLESGEVPACLPIMP